MSNDENQMTNGGDGGRPCQRVATEWGGGLTPRGSLVGSNQFGEAGVSPVFGDGLRSMASKMSPTLTENPGSTVPPSSVSSRLRMEWSSTEVETSMTCRSG